jgi:hypothetical protein
MLRDSFQLMVFGLQIQNLSFTGLRKYLVRRLSHMLAFVLTLSRVTHIHRQEIRRRADHKHKIEEAKTICTTKYEIVARSFDGSESTFTPWFDGESTWYRGQTYSWSRPAMQNVWRTELWFEMCMGLLWFFCVSKLRTQVVRQSDAVRSVSCLWLRVSRRLESVRYTSTSNGTC